MAYEPKGVFWDEFEVGQTFDTCGRTITEADVVNFAGLSGDFNPLHTDETFAHETMFGRRIAHGMLSVVVATGLANQLGIFEGTTVALMQQTIRYVGPVHFGDTISMRLTVASKDEKPKPERGRVSFAIEIVNQSGKPVIEGEWLLMMARKPAES